MRPTGKLTPSSRKKPWLSPWVIALLSALICCQTANTAQAKAGTTSKERSMAEAHIIDTDAPAIPLLDRHPPEIFETATFGLG